MRPTLALAAALLLSLPAAAQQAGTEGGSETPAAGTDLAIYRNDLALVSTRRSVDLEAGEAEIAMHRISPGIVPESLDLAGPGVRLIEQVLAPWPPTRERLLEAFVGETVTLVRPPVGDRPPVEQPATLLSVEGGVVVEVDGRIEAEPEGRIVFPAFPPTLSARPRATFRAAVAEAGSRTLVMRYLTHGLSWAAHYVARWKDRSETLDLTGIATLRSELPVPVSAESVRLVAGDVAVTDQGPPPLRPQMRTMAMTAEAAAAPPREQSRADLKVYRLARGVALPPHGSVQRPLLAADDVAVEQRYSLEDLAVAQPYGSEREAAAHLRLVIADTRAAGLPQALPAGTVRVYEGDIFRGAREIGDTPLGTELTLDLGAAFDVTARARQKVFERIGERAYETAQEIVLKNAKARAIDVRVVGSFPQEWRMLSESHPHELETATRPVWTVEVPAEGEATLSYRVRVER